VCAIEKALAPISKKFIIAAEFGSAQAKADIDMLYELVTFAAAKGQPHPYLFALRGANRRPAKKEIECALSCGVVKMDVGTDTQWALYDPRKWELTMVSLVKEASIGLKNGTSNGGYIAAADFVPKNEKEAAKMAELKETATKLCARGKGFLASDESAGPWLRAGHADAAKIPDTVENRAAYRAMCFSTPGLSDYISGVILHWETLFQKDATGKPMVDIIREKGMLAGIKVDKAYNKKGMWNTEVGPLGHPEVATLGLDDLQQRAAEAYAQGARFAKWRNVLQLDPAKGLPSDVAIADTVHTLARYASICQSEGLVPIVEPEIVPNGDHDIYYCAKMTEKVLTAQFEALKQHNVYLPGAVLKPNMVKSGIKGPKASTELIATLTCQTLLNTVPPSMPGIFFLSGETALDEDNEEVATINLSKMNELFQGKLPWHLSFSYGKALQKTCIVTWLGKKENEAAAQKALKARSAANTDAVLGKYKAGTCASIGTDGNVNQAAGPY
jgi:fructose-bisphosphate aldolase class I